MAKTIAFDIIARDKASKTFSKIGGAAKFLGVAGLGAVAASAVQTEAAFSKSMNVMQAATSASTADMAKMRAQAQKLGADTSFSANEAAEAMLELGKAGFDTKQIMSTVPEVMNLAATEGMALADAAGAVTSALAQFGMKANKSAIVVNALAGASLASKASVSGLSQSLSLVGSSAASTGMSVQDTTAALAALAEGGLEGSIAGTSLSSVLNRLVPTTKDAYDAMSTFGLVQYDANKASKVLAAEGIKAVSSSYKDTYNAVSKYLVKQGVAEEGTVKLADATEKYLRVTDIMHNSFLKQNGDFKDISAIAGIMQEKLSGLSQSQRKVAIGAIFGKDASTISAVNALISTGADGLKKYRKETKDQTAASRMSEAAMKGTGGALEKMQGSLEGASLAIGQMLAPAVVFLADRVGTAANKFVEFTPKIKAAGEFVKDNKNWFIALAAAIGTVIVATKVHAAVMTVQTAGGLIPLIKSTAIAAKVMKSAAAAQWIWNAAASAGNTVFMLRIRLALMDAAAWVRSKAAMVAHTVATKAAAAASAVGSAATAAFTAVTNALTLSNIRSAAAMAATRAGLIAGAVATKAVSAATKAYAAAQWLLNAAMAANPVGLVIVAIAALVAGVIIAYKKSDTFRGFVNKLGAALLKMGEWGVRAFAFLLNAAFKAFGGILAAADKGLGWIPGLGDKIGKAREAFKEFGDKTVGKLNAVADKLGAVSAKLNGIPTNKTVTVTLNIPNEARVNRVMEQLGSRSGRVRAYARGTNFHPGGVALVGEEGPELVNLPRGARVHTAQRTAAMSGSPADGGQIDYRLLARAIVEAMREGAPLVRLPDAGRGAYLQGVGY